MKKYVIDSPMDFVRIYAKIGRSLKKSEWVYSARYQKYLQRVQAQIEEDKKNKIEARKKYYRGQTEIISKRYSRQLLREDGFSNEDINDYPELAETKRNILKIKRELCNKQSQQM